MSLVYTPGFLLYLIILRYVLRNPTNLDDEEYWNERRPDWDTVYEDYDYDIACE